jgi:hypothetical protein
MLTVTEDLLKLNYTYIYNSKIRRSCILKIHQLKHWRNFSRCYRYDASWKYILAERISRVIGLDICGVDIMAENLTQP